MVLEDKIRIYKVPPFLLPHLGSKSQDELSFFVEPTAPVNARFFETGSIQRFCSHDFVLCFESEPFWIMSLNPIFTKSVFIDNAISTFSEFHTYLSQFRRLTLYTIFDSRLGRSKFQFNFQSDSVSSDSILLISGTPDFFQLCVTRYPSLRAKFLFDHHFPRHKSSISIRRLKHSQVGAPTSYISVIGYHNVTLSPNTTSISGTIKLFLRLQHAAVSCYRLLCVPP